MAQGLSVGPLMQRTGVLFPACISGSSQTPVILAPGEEAYGYTHTHTYTQLKAAKLFFKETHKVKGYRI